MSFERAALYGVAPKVLMQAVKRNAERFPADFMFQLDDAEWTGLKSQTTVPDDSARNTPKNLKSQITNSNPDGMARESSTTAKP
jgi:hypothetical protein